MISASLTDLVEYTLHAVGIGLMLIWVFAVTLVFARGQYQLGGVLFLLLLATVLAWLYNVFDDIR